MTSVPSLLEASTLQASQLVPPLPLQAVWEQQQGQLQLQGRAREQGPVSEASSLQT